MSVTPEQLAAYADGELDAAAARAVEAELAKSADLQAQLAAHRALKARLAAHFAPIAQQPVPEHLEALLRDAASTKPDDGKVIDLGSARERRSVRQPRGWARYVGPALAASLILAIVGIGLRPSGNLAEGALAEALDKQLAAEQTGGEPVRILISFRDKAGAYCRGYAEAGGNGIACREDRGWRIVQKFTGAGAGSSEYRQAGSGTEQLFEAAQDRANGDAFDDRAERAAKDRRWVN